MAIHYCYKIEPAPSSAEHVRAGFMRADGTLVRKLVIPESPDEELRGEKYDQDMINWLNESEKQHIKNNMPDGSVLVKVWTERVVKDRANIDKPGRVAQSFKMGPAEEPTQEG